MADETQNPAPIPVAEQMTDDKTGENNSPKAVEGAVEGGWNGSVAGTNDALEPDENTRQ